jgi:citrate lyase gamma subunit
MEIKTLQYSERNCPCCNNNNFEQLYESKKRTYAQINYEFNIHYGFCKYCGFAYTNPAPTEIALEKYYNDCLPYMFIDYSVENRIDIIRKFHPNNNGIYLELGCNVKNNFHNQLECIFDNVVLSDLNVKCDYVKIDKGGYVENFRKKNISM